MNTFSHLHLTGPFNSLYLPEVCYRREVSVLTYVSPDLPRLFSLLYCFFIILQTSLHEEALKEKLRKTKTPNQMPQKSFCIQLKTFLVDSIGLQNTTFTANLHLATLWPQSGMLSCLKLLSRKNVMCRSKQNNNNKKRAETSLPMIKGCAIKKSCKGDMHHIFIYLLLS